LYVHYTVIFKFDLQLQPINCRGTNGKMYSSGVGIWGSNLTHVARNCQCCTLEVWPVT